MNLHPVMSAEIIDYFDFASPEVAKAVRHHHERPDGLGYPKGLSGTNIPIVSRLLAIADSWDAMTTQRPYRPAYTLPAAVKELLAGDSAQFDGALVELFLKTLGKLRIISGRASRSRMVLYG